jgi:hypothetical protein
MCATDPSGSGTSIVWDLEFAASAVPASAAAATAPNAIAGTLFTKRPPVTWLAIPRNLSRDPERQISGRAGGRLNLGYGGATIELIW